MKKVLSVVCLLLLASGLLMAGGKAEQPGGAPAAPVPAARPTEVIEVKMGHVEPPGSPLDQAWQFFANWVENTSGGRLKVDVYPAGQLGGMTELFESVKTGTLKISQGDEGAMASFYEPFLIASVPYLFPNEEVALRFYDSEFFQNKINAGLAEKTGVRIIGRGSYGFRCWSNNKKEIRTPADFRGMKLRVMQTPLFMRYVQALGAAPTPISFPELYSALQQGVVDGQENPVSVILDQKFHEVQKHLTVDDHVAGVNTILVNEQWFQSLPEDLRQILYTGARIAGDIETGGRAYQTHVTALNDLKQKGMQIYVPTLAEKEAFKQASQKPVVDWLEGVIGKALVQEAFDAVAKIHQDMKSEIRPVR